MADTDCILIDMGSVFGAAWHASANESISHARHASLQTVRKIANGSKRVAVCCDSRKNWRKELDPQYKVQREPKPEAYYEELRRSEEALEREGFLVWRAEGFEADDVIATAATELSGAGYAVLIYSSDKDLTQLVRDAEEGDERGPIVTISIRDWKRYDEDEVKEKFGVPPYQMRDWLALVGDASDNIPGVKGIGPKTAAELLRKFDTAASVIVHTSDANGMHVLEGVVGKARAFNLQEGANRLMLSGQLTRLRKDAPINAQDIFEERKPLPLTQEPEEMPEETDIEEAIFERPRAEEKREPSQPSAPQPPPPVAPAVEIVPRTEQPAALVPYEQQLEPGSPKAAMVLAGWIHNSRLYGKFSSQEAIFAVIVRGREMGLGALTALDCFHVVEGKPALHAHLIVARAKALPQCEYFQFVGGDDTFAEYETKNRENPKPTKLRYTIDQARRADLVKQRGNWEKRPAEMLRKTCAVQLARMEYPEAAMGLYSIEELEGAS